MERLSTDCPPLDRLLDGGLEADAITLVFGEGGSGKTNLALQCARTAALAGKRVAFVDTEGVSSSRLEQVFATAEGCEERLLFYAPYTIQEQEHLVRNATMAPDLGLLVVDSINMHYRLHIDDDKTEREASRSLYKQLHHLTNFARQKQVPVLVTGQVYGGEDATQPFARRTMEHLVKALIRFEKRPDGTRRATMLKHRSIEEGRQTRFKIVAGGLAGPEQRTPKPAEDFDEPSETADEDSDFTTEPPATRSEHAEEPVDDPLDEPLSVPHDEEPAPEDLAEPHDPAQVEPEMERGDASVVSPGPLADAPEFRTPSLPSERADEGAEAATDASESPKKPDSDRKRPDWLKGPP